MVATVRFLVFWSVSWCGLSHETDVRITERTTDKQKARRKRAPG
jgi:hypothetical protein